MLQSASTSRLPPYTPRLPSIDVVGNDKLMQFNYDAASVMAGSNVFELDAVLSAESSQADVYVCVG